ncbi:MULTISPECIES: prepilin peptidase [unclassified Amycolatopsis]|uniref:prepilin peptidase n=1 Tax=unclassified Amycolatopsis TaxID=2618356 RepID=UPI00210774C6|nr:prepilin peptidase [Amycolatopsis sp. DSM 110486]
MRTEVTVQFAQIRGWSTLGAVVVGLVLGAAGSLLTRRFVPPGHVAARSWWLGALITAVVLGLVAWRVRAGGEPVVDGYVAVLAVPLAVIDSCEHRLPRALLWPQLGGALLGFSILCVVRNDSAPGVRAVAALAAAAGLFLVLALVTAGEVGAGDISAAAVVGLVTGWLGWPFVGGALLTASVLALVLVAVPGVRQRNAAGVVLVPFGPCLYAGALVMVVAAA